MRAAISLLLAIGLLASMPVAAAAGGQPIREFLQAPDTIELPDTCPFPVLLTVLVNQEYLLSFPDGRQIITGNLVIGVTNENTGAYVVINASGPGHISADGTFTAQGNLLQWGPGVDGLQLFEGNKDFFTGIGPGRSVSVCDMVAG